ncbi:hypothetical protein FC81_GL000607 [Liquorilactobacillus capillatus DSM 19910]|uniref:Uncharacterized protein n=2 Tax=Liquorilactobacillus capillatus TaxID=480931 RepID=A0A0R1M3U6_9LACO|nr:hypothetical protein FC81_GL000607 [Liquorilactobacillus capillatus DSM 19910]
MEAMVGLLLISAMVILFFENEHYFVQRRQKAFIEYTASEQMVNLSKKMLLDNEKKVLVQNERGHLQNKVSAKTRYGTLEVKIKKD